jgi:hypothetical protein
MIKVRLLVGLLVLSAALAAVRCPVSADDDQGVFSGAVGPLFMSALLDPSAVQNLLPGLGFAGDLNVGGSELFLLHGGGGFAGSDPLRMGYLWTDGRWSLALNKDSKFDRAALSLGYGGAMLERLVSESGNVGFSLGAVLGGGEWGLQLSKTPLGSFEDLLLNPPVSLALHRSFWFVLPYVSAEFKILDFAGMRVGVGFWQALSFDDWRLSDGQSVVGGPLKSTGCPVFQLMLVLGG